MGAKKFTIVHLEDEPQYVFPIAANLSIKYEVGAKANRANGYEFEYTKDRKTVRIAHRQASTPFELTYVCVGDADAVEHLRCQAADARLFILDYCFPNRPTVVSSTICRDLIAKGVDAEDIVVLTALGNVVAMDLRQYPEIASVKLLHKGGDGPEIVSYIYEWLCLRLKA